MKLRGIVLGLGMMGRHHARILQQLERVEFVGAVDQIGDQHAVVADQGRVYKTFSDLVAQQGAPDFAVVALPTEEHFTAGLLLADAGVHMLIEKPIADTTVNAERLISRLADAGLHGAVGHVERCNPALIELRRRLRNNEIGKLIHITTRRNGPFPARIKDVGVVKDLATHDLDLVGWLAESPVSDLSAQTQYLTGRDHEDLVNIVGRLQNGMTFNTSVDWLTPTKVRQTIVLGEKGMFVADTLTSDLTHYENPETSSEWGASQALRGVAEGNMTRFALARQEPIRVELEGFVDLIEGKQDPYVVTLQDGIAALQVAEAVLVSANENRVVQVPPVNAAELNEQKTGSTAEKEAR